MPESPPTSTIRQYITGTARAGEPSNLSPKCARTRALTHRPCGVGGDVHLEGSSEGPKTCLSGLWVQSLYKIVAFWTSVWCVHLCQVGMVGSRGL
jgi:hypothetical protein